MSATRFIRDTFILVVSFLGPTLLYRTVLRRRRPLVRVLVFHDVRDSAWFEEIVRSLRATHHLISPEDFSEQRFASGKINVLITFDDGYTSWVDACLPILEKYSARALFFVNSGLVCAYGDGEVQKRYVREKLLLSPRETISWDGVRALQSAGHTVGGHTVNHERLSILTEEMQVREVRDDKETLERELGRHITAFAYPFGNHSDYTETTVRAVKGAGYTYAFTTAGAFTDVRRPYALSRTCVEDGQSPESLNRWILGGYDVYRSIKELCAQ